MADKQEAKVLSFREKFLAQAGKYKSKVVEVEDIGRAELREPSAEQRAMIYKNAQKITQKGKETHIVTDPAALNVWSIIVCTYDPTTGAKMFDYGDYDTLANMSTSILDTLAKPVMEFMGEDEDEEDTEKKSKKM